MPPKIKIAVNRPGLPPGMVLSEDAGSLSSGFHDSLARLVQRQLGFPWRVKLLAEAKRLTRLALTEVSDGSGILHYEALPSPGASGLPPAAVAAIDLVNGLQSFIETQRWPAYLPAVVRNRFGAALAPVLSDADTRVSIAVEHDGFALRCEITSPLKDALQTPEDFAPDEPIELIGKMVELDRRDFSFKVEVTPRTIGVEVSEQLFARVESDEMRWRRVFVAGLPKDEKCRTVYGVTELRLADDSEADGLSIPSELRRGERTETYQQVSQRAQRLLVLPEGWNTYDARSPSSRATIFALHFLRDAIGVLLDHGIQVPPPFFVPTPSGGVQYEWHVEGRELELEIPEKGHFEYLATDGLTESEGEASRWMAMRLLRWVITGEEV